MPDLCAILPEKYEHMFVFFWQVCCKINNFYAIIILQAQAGNCAKAASWRNR